MLLTGIIVLNSFLLPCILNAAEPVQVKYEDLPALVDKGNREVKGSILNVESVEARTGHFGRSFLPVVSGEAGIETFRFAPYDAMTYPYGKVEATLNLFRGGRDRLEDHVRQAEFEFAKSTRDIVRWKELTAARKTFWDLIFSREMVGLFQESLQFNQKNSAAAKKRIDAGLASETDRIEFEISRSQIEESLASAQLEVGILQRALAIDVGLEKDSVIDPVGSFPDSVIPELALPQSVEPLNGTQHREVRALESEISASEAKATQSKRWWVPAVDAYGSIGLLTFKDREMTSWQERVEPTIGIMLKMDLFDGFESQVSSRSFSARAKAIKMSNVDIALELEAKKVASVQRLKLGVEQIRKAEKTYELGQTYLKKSLDEYSRGIKNSPDVLGATERSIELKRKLIELKRDFQLERVEFESLFER